MTLYRGFSTQEELDEQYDVRAAVGEGAFQAYLDDYAQLSERAREQLPCELGVRYGPTRAETLDLFHPPTAMSGVNARPESEADGAPLLVFFHGGFWRARSAREFSLCALGPAAAGIATAVVDYALCPKVTIAEIVRQARAAIAFLHTHASNLGIDRKRIVVCGDSAGAQLTALCLATDWEGDYALPVECLQAGIGISGVYDLLPLPHSFLAPALQLSVGDARRLSPLHELPERSPPLLITYGERDTAEFGRQSKDFYAARRWRGLPGEIYPQPDADHFSALIGLAKPSSELSSQIVRFVGEHAFVPTGGS